MHDFYFGNICLRVFWRGAKGIRHPFPYVFHRWGFYGFGMLLVGFMLWAGLSVPRSATAGMVGGKEGG